MGVYLNGWVEVQIETGKWLGVIKIQQVLWSDLKGAILQELYDLAEGSDLPPDASDEVRQDDPVRHGMRPYYVTWDKVWKVDTVRVGRSWWVLLEMVGALKDPLNSDQQYRADKIRLVFWAG